MKIKLLMLLIIMLMSQMAHAESENISLALKGCTALAPENYRMLYAVPSDTWNLQTATGKRAALAMSSGGKNYVVDLLRNYFGEEYQVYNSPSTSVRLSYVNLIYGDEAMRREMTPERARTLIYVISRPVSGQEGDPNGSFAGLNHALLWTSENKHGLNYLHFLEAIKFYREDGTRIVGTPLPKLMDLLWQDNPGGALAYLDQLSQTPAYKSWWAETQDLCIMLSKKFDLPGWRRLPNPSQIPHVPVPEGKPGRDWSWLP